MFLSAGKPTVPQGTPKWLLGAALGILLLSWACDSSNPTEPPPMGAIVTGTWDLNVTVVSGTAAAPGTLGTMIATLDQTGTNVSGTFVFDDGDSGTVSGRLSVREFIFEATQTTAGCPGLFSGSATVSASNSSMSGDYTGEACGGTVSAEFSGFKRQ